MVRDVAARPIPLSSADIGSEERLLVNEVLRTGRLSMGPMLERFESTCAERFGARHAIGVSSGTAALHVSLLAADVGERDLVITTPFSFVASANAILYERAIPLFVDVDPVTLTIDPEATLDAVDAVLARRAGWERLLPPGLAEIAGPLRAIVPVDVFGRVAEQREIVAAARRHGLAVVEDACEAIGASLDGVPAGRFGDAGTFGFFPNKQMTTGEGGIVLTDDDRWAATMRSLRSQGRDETDWLRHDRLGYNYRLDELSAAIGLAQIEKLDDLLGRRASVAAMYDARIAGIEGVTPPKAPRAGMDVSWFVYVVRLDPEIDRDALALRLDARGVPTRPYFWPIHLQPLYRRRFGYRRGAFPNAEAAGDSLLALPFHGRMPETDVDLVCEALASEVALARRAAVR